MTESAEQFNGQPSDTGSAEKIRPKCLLVDDYGIVVSNVSRFFRELDNFVAVECHSVQDALDAIRKNSPKILFLDHSLTRGGAEGIEIADRAREMIPDIEIYSTTSNGLLDEYKERGIKHIDKIDLSGLRAIISGK
jgi:CheY-like chemotaxis protein